MLSLVPPSFSTDENNRKRDEIILIVCCTSEDSETMMFDFNLILNSRRGLSSLMVVFLVLVNAVEFANKTRMLDSVHLVQSNCLLYIVIVLWQTKLPAALR